MRIRDLIMMDKIKTGVLLLAGLVILSACAQRSDDATVSGTGQPQYNANGEPIQGAAEGVLKTLTVRVVSNANSIDTGGTDVATITALVTDENNNAVGSEPITFSSTGGVLQDITPQTDENGEASATLKLPQDFQNQDIIITGTAGSYSASVMVTASGSTLEVTGPDTLVLGDQAELVVSLAAGNGEPISNQVVTLSSEAGNTISPASPITDSDGRVTVLVGTENFDDTIRVSALNGTVNTIHSFDVAEDVIQFASGTSESELPVAQSNPITVTWTSQGQAVAGSQLRFSTTAGEIVGDSLLTTNSAGQVTVQVRSSSAGPAKITVEAADDSNPNTSVDIEFVATTPAKVDIDASSSRVHTQETSTIMALVTDANGNPVKNQVVDFTSGDLKGGQLNPASAKSNSSGVASVTFTAGTNATEIDDVQIQAQVKSTSLNDTMNLTVVKRALNVTIGTSNKIAVKPLGTQYALPFIVQVADGSGTPLEDATVKLSVTPFSYRKGQMVLVDETGFEYSPAIEDWTADHWAISSSTVTCASEDLNGNRILDTQGTFTEDLNGNGSLDPQDPASLIAVEDEGYATIEGGSLSTDKNGSGFFELVYPASNSLWAGVVITARAEALGAESDDSFVTVLPLLASEANDIDVSPSNHVSPYGVVPDCTSTN